MNESPLIYMPNKRFQEVDANLATEKFTLKSKLCAEKLIRGEVIYFSDIVTQFSGLSQLICESEGYCFGEGNGDLTPLNSKQIIRLEYAILSILKSIIAEIRRQNPELPFKLQRSYDANEGCEILQLIENEHISQETRENVFSILEGHTQYLEDKSIKSP